MANLVGDLGNIQKVQDDIVTPALQRIDAFILELQAWREMLAGQQIVVRIQDSKVQCSLEKKDQTS